MTDVVFYFQVHQPYRLHRGPSRGSPRVGRAQGVAEEETTPPDLVASDVGLDELVLRRVAERCYLPTNRVLREAIDATDGQFRCAFSLSGTLISQCERWAPEVLESFQDLAKTGSVEFLAETSHHSLAALANGREFHEQIRHQARTIEQLCGRRPTAFRNTELILDESIARAVEDAGFEVLLGEGADALLGDRTPHRVYRCRSTQRLRLLLRDYARSDDIAFRFSDTSWSGFPLFAEPFAQRLAEGVAPGGVLGLFMDYETFGEHQAADTGVLKFLRSLPEEVLRQPSCRFATPTEVARRSGEAPEIAIARPFSWADEQRDLSAWLANPMQKDAHRRLYRLLPRVQAARDESILETWRRLSTSDHVYYMATGGSSDAEVHGYFSHFDHPWAAYVAFQRAVDELEASLPTAAREPAAPLRSADPPEA